jgi:hypothetical protein
MLTPTRQHPNIRAVDADVSQAQRDAEEVLRTRYQEKVEQLSLGGKIPVALRRKADGYIVRFAYNIALEALLAGGFDLAVSHK